MKKMIWMAAGIIVCVLVGCAPVNPTTLTIYNASDRAIKMVALSGIQLYQPGTGPQDFGDFAFRPNFYTRMTTWQTVCLIFPIRVKWQYESYGETQTSELTRIINRPEKGSTLKECGNLLLVFETNETWSITYMPGDVAPPVQDLEKLYKRGVSR